MRHFQALVRMDTSDPPGNEVPAVEYLKRILEAEGIEAKVFALDPQRPNLVARLRGNSSKRPLLIMAHTDTVNIDPKKWKHGPFSATREGGYVYGRGTVDDKDNVTSSLMTMLLLKRSKVALDRDVIFLAEAGEEGNVKFGIEFMSVQPAGGPSKSGGSDVLNALLALGYNEREAIAAVKPLPAGLSVSDGIRQALKSLSKT